MFFRGKRDVTRREEISHFVKITDEYIHDWTMNVDNNDTLEMQNNPIYEPTIEDDHEHLHERTYYLPIIHSFFSEFDNYSINTPYTQMSTHPHT